MKSIALLLSGLLLSVAALAQTSILIPAQSVPLPTTPPTCVALNTNPAQTLCGPGLTITTTAASCGTAVKPASMQAQACPAGTIGTWTQTRSVTAIAAPSCWLPGPWSPTSPPAGSCPSSTPPPPPPPPPPAGSFIIYNNGTFNLPGADNWCMKSVNYQDTTGAPQGGIGDAAITLACANGGWQPLFVPNGSTTFFDISGYKTLSISIKPPADNAGYWLGIAGNLDTADGIQIQIAGPGFTKYGPATKKGQWANYKVPLADLQMTDPKNVFKFGLADGTGLPAGTVWYVDAVFLTVN